MPKQFIGLLSGRTLFEAALDRVSDSTLYNPPLVICARQHHHLVRHFLADRPAEIMMEPVGRNTAAALCAAALSLEPEQILLMLPSDHYIPDTARFTEIMRSAVPLAAEGFMVLFGVHPASAHTGYGYIKQGDAPHIIAHFKEKPDQETARRYLEEGGYFWNTGIFMMKAGTCLAEMEKHAPDILAAVRKAYGLRDQNVLDQDSFAVAPSVSIDYAIMEKTDRARLVTADMDWNDLGSWDALWDVSQRDANENAFCGDVMARDVQRSYIHSTGPVICAVGIEDMIVVSTGDAVFLAPRNRSEEIRHMVEHLKTNGHMGQSKNSQRRKTGT